MINQVERLEGTAPGFRVSGFRVQGLSSLGVLGFRV